MNWTRWTGWLALPLAGAMLFGVGCTREQKKKDDPQAKAKKEIPKEEVEHGWWCFEHGVPEEICSLCSDEAAAKFKKEGDWCKLHDRAQSQCFKCDPSLYKKYEDMYLAKYGKKPKPPPKEEFEKD
jgi:hypothetical protein